MPSGSFGKIEYIIVLVQENQSFDRKFGYSGINGTDAATGGKTEANGLVRDRVYDQAFPNGQVLPLPATPDADVIMAHDPGHDFLDVQEQLCGPGNRYGTAPLTGTGYVSSYARTAQPRGIPFDDAKRIMAAFNPANTDPLPISHRLGREFCLCDNWRASVPGPTWPNRFFFHAATSGGLIASPDPTEILSNPTKYNRDATGFFKFSNGTIYKSFDAAHVSWCVYRFDLPQIASIEGMMVHMLPGGKIKEYAQFKNDIQNGTLAQYSFIEPDYKTQSNFAGGNSEHAVGDIREGEKLIKNIYETVRNSSIWDKTLLVIVYDEHGGYFDHELPPVNDQYATGDDDRYNGDPVHFDFRTLGVRVPALIISPWIPKNLIDHTLYDHTSLLATVEKRWGLRPLTRRDASARAFDGLFLEDQSRQDTPEKLPDVPEPTPEEIGRLLAHRQADGARPIEGAS